MQCIICNNLAKPIFNAKVMGRFDVDYHQCPECLFIRPSKITWLEEAYSSAITDTDVGLVSRNSLNIRIFVPLFDLLLREEAKVLDVGGGYGLFCRALRDQGFHACWSDPYCENIFAKDHEFQEGEEYDVLCAFEVFEHLEDPVTFLKDQYEKFSPDFVCFSTLCYDGETAPDKTWHYYAFETGQHISLYNRKSLEYIAKDLGVYYFELDKAYHLFHKKPLSHLQKLLIRRRTWLSRLHLLWVTFKRRGHSLTPLDYEIARDKLRNSQIKNEGEL